MNRFHALVRASACLFAFVSFSAVANAANGVTAADAVHDMVNQVGQVECVSFARRQRPIVGDVAAPSAAPPPASNRLVAVVRDGVDAQECADAIAEQTGLSIVSVFSTLSLVVIGPAEGI
jgi:hypothetical protein